MDQDWDTVVIRKKPQGGVARSSAAVNAAKQSGAQVEAQKKFTAGSNKAHKGPDNAAKLEAETEDFHHDAVSFDLRMAIQKGRLAKKMSQAALANAINEKANVINEYESGRAIPNNQILGKLERALGVKLRGGQKKKK